MDIAMQCALAAYDGQYSPQVSGIQLTYQAHRQALETSAARTIRCTIASKLAPNNSEEVFPVFVLAVRGSTSFLDHMSNLNSAPKDVRDFIVGVPVLPGSADELIGVYRILPHWITPGLVSAT